LIFQQIFFLYSVEECLQEIKNINSIILDAFTEGRVIKDNINIFNTMKDKILKFLKAKNLLKTDIGWLFNP